MLPRLCFLGILLAAIRPVAGQSCSDNPSISSQSDIAALSDCDNISGTVTIASDASGSLNLDGLENIRGDLVVEGTENLNSLSLPDIENIRGTVTVKDNANLNSLDLSGLASLGGDLTIQNNPSLLDLTMDDLENVDGGLQLQGEFNSISFSNLETVSGESNITSTGTAGCSALDSLNSSNDDGAVFRGSYTCATTTTSTPTPSPTASTAPTPTSTTTPDNSNSLSNGAIAGIVIGAVVGLLIILLLCWFIIRRRKKQRAALASSTDMANVTVAGGAVVTGVTRLASHRGKDEEQPSLMQTSSLDEEEDNNTHASPVPSALPGTNRASMPLPLSLMPGTGRASKVAPSSPLPPGGSGGEPEGDPDSLFLTAVPASGRPPNRGRQPSESDVPMLDSEDVHEMPTERESEQVFELDAGPVTGTHQRAINHETDSPGAPVDREVS